MLFNEVQQTAQTHVFIIGVGGYPYLAGGTQEKAQILDGAKQLKQLSSPQVSVESFYNTVMDLHKTHAWMKPLGSIELLLSPAPGGKQVFGGAVQQPATIANIKAAYWKWKTRCDTIGHGLFIYGYVTILPILFILSSIKSYLFKTKYFATTLSQGVFLTTFASYIKISIVSDGIVLK
jgi:hypothetical protein